MGLISMIRDQVATPRRVPNNMAVAVMSTDRGRVAKGNAKALRAWSERSEWIRAAINIRKTQVTGAEWDISPADPDKKTDTGLQREIRDRLEFANPKAESFRVLLEKVVEDILVLDAGSMEIESNLRGEPLYLHDVDGATVRVSMLWDGTDPQEPRYFWYPDNFERGRWRNDQFIYIMETPRTNSVVGLSKLETLALSIDAELEGHSYNARQVRNATPDGLLHLGEGAKQQNIDSFRAFWQAEQGRGALAITGGTKEPSFIKFHDSNRDMQFLEWQIYLVRKIAAVMQMDPGDLGIGMDINRSTAEVRDNQTEDRGIRPLMDLLRRHITREVVWSPGFGGQANNLAFRWTKLNLKESMAQAQIFKIALGGMPYKPVNEARKDIGLEPLGPEFDQLAMVTPQGAFSLEGLPTIGEFLEISHPKPTAVPSSTSKDEQIERAIAELRMLAMSRRDEPDVHVHLDAGAVDVDVHAPTTIEKGAVALSTTTSVPGGAAATVAREPVTTRRAVTRESTFKMDNHGRMIGKEEHEIIAKTEEQKAAEAADVARLQAELEIASKRLEEPVVSVVRSTLYDMDDKGRIIGKKETEQDGD